MAGLLTYSPLGTFPICSVISGMSFFQQVEWSLQQRDCSGLSPDSLFIRVSEQTPEHHFGRKGNTNGLIGKKMHYIFYLCILYKIQKILILNRLLKPLEYPRKRRKILPCERRPDLRIQEKRADRRCLIPHPSVYPLPLYAPQRLPVRTGYPRPYLSPIGVYSTSSSTFL